MWMWPSSKREMQANTGHCFEITDSSVYRKSAEFLLGKTRVRDTLSQAARLGQQFLRQNRWIFSQFDVEADLDFDGSRVDIILRSHSKVGAMPLYSPTSGKPDYGLMVKPRFDWNGLGAMLGGMGWKIIPEPISLPMLPKSDRKIPPWVLSTVVLFRLKGLLDLVERRFDYQESDLNAPRGSVDWNRYCGERLGRMQHLKIPCRFPDLLLDSDLLAAIHFALRVQRMSLESQRQGGIAVLQLLDVCERLLSRVRRVPPQEPAPRIFNLWLRRPLHGDPFEKGIQAIQWTAEERGLAGLSDLSGLPWRMSMADFYEAWVETVAIELTKYLGGSIRVGRRNETTVPISWEKPYLGSQKSLKPDIVLERMDETIIIDAKFKEHWQELSETSWGKMDSDVRERHRADILQILAYSSLFSTKKISACLAYPCRKRTWERLTQRGEVYRNASLYSGKRKVDLVLTAIPMVGGKEEVAKTLVQAFRGN